MVKIDFLTPEVLWSFSRGPNPCRRIFHEAWLHQAGPKIHLFIKHVFTECPACDRHGPRYWSYHVRRTAEYPVSWGSEGETVGKGKQRTFLITGSFLQTWPGLKRASFVKHGCGQRVSLEEEKKLSRWSLRGNLFKKGGMILRRRVRDFWELDAWGIKWNKPWLDGAMRSEGGGMKLE